MQDEHGRPPLCEVDAIAEADGLAALLASHSLDPPPSGSAGSRAADCDVLRWAATGAMALTGRADGPPLASVAPVASRLAAAGVLLAALTARFGARVDIDLAVVLSGRATANGWRRRGATSVGGSCRLLRAEDGWVALNLARPSDFELVPALLGRDLGGDDPWCAVEDQARRSSASELAERAQLLGMAAAELVEPGQAPSPWRIARRGGEAPGRGDRWTVLDLSSMWAGPLCAHLLGRAGARVVKVEASTRPDGARHGPAAFYDWLHDGHLGVALDFTAPGGVEALRSLLTTADVVIEASRPRALRHLGIDAERWVEERPGRTWLSITGHGRTGPRANWVGFGDDAAVAGGLVAYDDGRPVFCADALADPATGLLAAVAVAASVAAGGGHFIEASLRDAAAWLAAAPRPGSAVPHEVRRQDDHWTVRHGDHVAPVVEGVRLPPASPVRPMGADTDAVLGAVDRS